MLTYIDTFFADPKGMIIFFLLAFPGRLLAISAHEFAHAWVADRCGDHTARMMGRLTMNPLKHLDPMGAIMMLLVGFGWAKPVPVNPRNYRDYRRDDLKVSVAGVAMNLLLFLLGTLLMLILSAIALSGDAELGRAAGAMAQSRGFYNMTINLLFYRFGDIAGYASEMLYYFILTNIVLCVFNLLPVPPLDGYHVLNDLILKKPLFADPRTARIASSLLFVLVMTGLVGRVLGYVDNFIMNAVGNSALSILRAVGLMG